MAFQQDLLERVGEGVVLMTIDTDKDERSGNEADNPFGLSGNGYSAPTHGSAHICPETLQVADRGLQGYPAGRATL